MFQSVREITRNCPSGHSAWCGSLLFIWSTSMDDKWRSMGKIFPFTSPGDSSRILLLLLRHFLFHALLNHLTNHLSEPIRLPSPSFTLMASLLLFFTSSPSPSMLQLVLPRDKLHNNNLLFPSSASLLVPEASRRFHLHLLDLLHHRQRLHSVYYSMYILHSISLACDPAEVHEENFLERIWYYWLEGRPCLLK